MRIVNLTGEELILIKIDQRPVSELIDTIEFNPSSAYVQSDGIDFIRSKSDARTNLILSVQDNRLYSDIRASLPNVIYIVPLETAVALKNLRNDLYVAVYHGIDDPNPREEHPTSLIEDSYQLLKLPATGITYATQEDLCVKEWVRVAGTEPNPALPVIFQVSVDPA